MNRQFGVVFVTVGEENRVRHAGKRGLFVTLAVAPTCFQWRSRKFTSLAPLGERVDCSRRFHQPGQDG
jgi:hypothetical protein